jgi:hypothetical protein
MMAQLDTSNPKTLVSGGLFALALVGGGIGGGSLMGYTIEPESVTQLRVDKAKLEVRLEVMEDIIQDCETLVKHAKREAAK